MTARLLSCITLLVSLWAGAAAAQDFGACPAMHVMTPSEVSARWNAMRARDAEQGIVRIIDASNWRRTPSYTLERVNQNGSNDVSTVRQRGPWRRIDRTLGRQRQSEYLNLETGVRVSVRRVVTWDHPDTTVEATRPQTTDVWRRWRMTQTERGETHLGERCTIARFDTVETRSESGIDTLPTEVCVTRDGIELWRRTATLPNLNNGLPIEHQVATRLSRERVALEDVRPPREFLTWAFWRDHANEVAQSVPEGGEAGQGSEAAHTICYQERGGAGLKQVRLTGDWRYIQDDNSNLNVAGPGLQLALSADRDGPYMLTMRAWRPRELRHPSYWSDQGERDRGETILGERCAWQTSDIVAASELPSAWCITADGIALAMSPPHFEAFALQRGPLAAEAFEPPEQAFTWIYAR